LSIDLESKALALVLESNALVLESKKKPKAEALDSKKNPKLKRWTPKKTQS
jgi:hypothetical protein